MGSGESPVLHWRVGIVEQFQGESSSLLGQLGGLSPHCPRSWRLDRGSVVTGRAWPANASSREMQGTIVGRGYGSAPVG